MNSKHTRNPRKLRDVGLRRFRGDALSIVSDRVHPVMRVARIPMNRIVIGAVVLARVTYAEVADYKIRPVVVIGSHGDSVSVRPCTSSDRALRRSGSVLLADLDHAGLKRQTAVLPQTLTLAIAELVAVEGRLSDRDLARIQHPAGQGRRTTTAPVRTLKTPMVPTPASLTIPRTHGAAA